jgi:hypothetical protein
MASAVASCEPGDILVAGGHAVSSEYRGHSFRVNTSSPRSATSTEWLVRVENLDDSPIEFHARAVCLTVGTPPVG